MNRNEFHSVKYHNKKFKNAANQNLLKSKSKSYKKVMNQCYKKYNELMEKEIRNTSKYDPKSFWKLLNKYCGQKINTRPIYQ